MKKIKVGIVNYLNTKPLLHGIEHSKIIREIDLVQDYPSNIASLLMEKKIDLGLVPVSVIPAMSEHHIVTDYCIGCNGPVVSVCLFGEVPIEKIDRIFLDYQSRTSVALTKILLQHYWKISPELINTKSDYRAEIKGTTAGLIIGDRSFEQRKISPYVYDLGEAWKDLTGLPFVFAAWVSNSKLDLQFVSDFNEANKYGVEHIDEIVKKTSFPLFDLRKYFTRYVSYQFDSEKRKGLEMFMKMLEVPVRR